jgi:CheY-like chemotaxis protein/anti-sigma regulatory factor (Ser/Thr protein kinase)
MIDKAAQAQQQLIDDLLDVSRMSVGTLRLNPRVTRLDETVRAAIESVRPSAAARRVSIESDLAYDVGLVHVDPDRIQQVLWNLLSNAIKFTPGGGRIEVSLVRSGATVEIVVRDTGSGIRKEFLAHVFDRFRQDETVTTRQHGGLGLGLAIGKQLVELHGGTITAESEGEGRGSTFRVRLPLRSVTDEPEESPQTFARDQQELNGMQILLVEDDPAAREATQRVLETHGAAVRAVAAAEAAVDAYARERPSAMIVDIGLPGEDGYSLVQRVRTLEESRQLAKVPAIAVTAFARAHDRLRAIEAGFDEHLAKPVDPAALIAILLKLAAAGTKE